MSNRPSGFVLMLRYLVTVLFFTFLALLFWNTISGTAIFPLKVVIGVSMVLTVIITGIGWLVVTLGGEATFLHD